jgi:hypothetical protein
MENKAVIQGPVHTVTDVEHFGSKGFHKRQVVILDETDDRYPKHIPVTVTGDLCDAVDDWNPGDEVRIQYKLTGRYWDEGKKYFVDVEALKLVMIARDEFHDICDDTEPASAAAPATSGNDEDLPF